MDFRMENEGKLSPLQSSTLMNGSTTKTDYMQRDEEGPQVIFSDLEIPEGTSNASLRDNSSRIASQFHKASDDSQLGISFVQRGQYTVIHGVRAEMQRNTHLTSGLKVVEINGVSIETAIQAAALVRSAPVGEVSIVAEGICLKVKKQSHDQKVGLSLQQVPSEELVRIAKVNEDGLFPNLQVGQIILSVNDRLVKNVSEALALMKTTELTIVAVDPSPILASEKEEPNGTDDTLKRQPESTEEPVNVKGDQPRALYGSWAVAIAVAEEVEVEERKNETDIPVMGDFQTNHAASDLRAGPSSKKVTGMVYKTSSGSQLGISFVQRNQYALIHGVRGETERNTDLVAGLKILEINGAPIQSASHAASLIRDAPVGEVSIVAEGICLKVKKQSHDQKVGLSLQQLVPNEGLVRIAKVNEDGLFPSLEVGQILFSVNGRLVKNVSEALELMKTTELTIVAVDPSPILASEKEELNGTDDTELTGQDEALKRQPESTEEPVNVEGDQPRALYGSWALAIAVAEEVEVEEWKNETDNPVRGDFQTLTLTPNHAASDLRAGLSSKKVTGMVYKTSAGSQLGISFVQRNQYALIRSVRGETERNTDLVAGLTILEINGAPIHSASHAASLIRDAPAGEVSIVAEGICLKVKKQSHDQKVGLSLQQPVPNEGLVRIAKVYQDGLFPSLEVGQILFSVNGQIIHEVTRALELLKQRELTIVVRDDLEESPFDKKENPAKTKILELTASSTEETMESEMDQKDSEEESLRVVSSDEERCFYEPASSTEEGEEPINGQIIHKVTEALEFASFWPLVLISLSIFGELRAVRILKQRELTIVVRDDLEESPFDKKENPAKTKILELTTSLTEETMESEMDQKDSQEESPRLVSSDEEQGFYEPASSTEEGEEATPTGGQKKRKKHQVVFDELRKTTRVSLKGEEEEFQVLFDLMEPVEEVLSPLMYEILMVNAMFKSAGEKAKQDYSNGVTYANPDKFLEKIYNLEHSRTPESYV